MFRKAEARKAGEPFELGEAITRRVQENQRMEPVTLADGVRRCPRCGSAHLTAITALPLARPIKLNFSVTDTHYFHCPANGQPVLLSTIPSAVLPTAERALLR